MVKAAKKKRALPVAKTSEAESDEQRNLRHGEAFRDTDKNEIEILHFAVGRLCEAVRDLRAEYMADLQRVEAAAASS